MMTEKRFNHKSHLNVLENYWKCSGFFDNKAANLQPVSLV